MALLFKVAATPANSALLIEQQYYVTCHRLGIDPQIAARKKYEHHDWYTAQRFLKLIPDHLRKHFINALKDAPCSHLSTVHSNHSSTV